MVHRLCKSELFTELCALSVQRLSLSTHPTFSGGFTACCTGSRNEIRQTTASLRFPGRLGAPWPAMMSLVAVPFRQALR